MAEEQRPTGLRARKTFYPKAYNVRVSQTMAERIQRYAQDDERPPTTWIREILRTALDAEAQRREPAQ